MPQDAITVPGVLESLSTIRNYVRQAAEQAGIDSKRAYRLRLAVDEIATNIALHGYQENDLVGEIQVRATVDDKTLTIQIEDEAIPFDPLGHPRPNNLDLPIEARPYGGLGVYLAVQNVDRFDYQYANGRNYNILILNRNSGRES
jgi:anti-sigma regulatory factor (Ser/Thr protein kinase)